MAILICINFIDLRNIWFCDIMTQYEQTSLFVLLWQESVIKHFSFFHTPLFFVFFCLLFVYCLSFYFEEFVDGTVNSLFHRQQLHYYLSAVYFDKVLLVSASLNSVTKNVSLKITYRFILLSYNLLVFQTLISQKGIFWLYLVPFLSETHPGNFDSVLFGVQPPSFSHWRISLWVVAYYFYIVSFLPILEINPARYVQARS